MARGRARAGDAARGAGSSLPPLVRADFGRGAESSLRGWQQTPEFVSPSAASLNFLLRKRCPNINPCQEKLN